MYWFLAAAGGYLLGSIPFGLIIGRLFGGVDVRTIGSGNIGATNVLRTGRKELAAATLFLDAAKGAVAVLLARYFLGETAALIAGAAAFVGHVWPIWLGFRGGKGVATLLGIAFALMSLAGFAFCVAWLAISFISHHSSAGGMAGGFGAAFAAFSFGRTDLGLVFLALAGLVVWTHRSNIERIKAGTEPRMGKKKA